MAGRTRDETADAPKVFTAASHPLAADLPSGGDTALADALNDPNAVRYIREGRALPLSVKPALADTFEALRRAERLAIDDQRVMPQTKLFAYRAAVFTEAAKHVQVPAEITQWAADMTMVSGKATTRCWWSEYPWIVALLVARFGENPEKWPDRLNGDDVRRAREWMAGDAPEAIAFGTAQALLGKLPGVGG